MQPYKWPLWISLFSSVVVIGSILYLLDKFSPFSRFYAKAKPGTINNEDEDDQPLNFSGSMWFVWGVLLDSGIGERTPRSFSARVLGMVWCGFSMIMVASYTANLAAFLVLDQPKKSLTGITDSRLRNPTVNFKYATVESTNVYNYFKSHAELSTMFRMMESNNYANSTCAIQAILSGPLWFSTKSLK
uniref:Ionotropic glutamate receptor C-terminal domain-containing protein n=1 Tax=Romanomermis culicivorax TaxID=13658 RepID=A0A915HPC8_ROMCU